MYINNLKEFFVEKNNSCFKVMLIALLVLSFSLPLFADEGGEGHKDDGHKDGDESSHPPHELGVKETMQKIMGAYKAAKDHAEHSNYFEAAVNLMEVAKLFKALDKVEPAGGNKKEWDNIHHKIIGLAFKGIGYCGTKNHKKLLAVIKDIGKFQQKGHAKFK